MGLDVGEFLPPPLPPAATPILRMFSEVSSRRGMGMNGPDPLSWADIHYWTLVMKRSVTRFEVNCICELDDTYLRGRYK